jgi:lambda family phage portal protein
MSLASRWNAWRTRRRAAKFHRLAAAAGQSRSYTGAQRGRRNSINMSGADGNAEVEAGAQSLRDKSSDRRRNDPYGAQILRTRMADLIGTGIRPQSNIILSRGGEAGEPVPHSRMNARVESLWADWSKTCDVEGLLDIYGIQARMAGAADERGDVFAVRRWRTDGALKIPIKIMLLEADQLDNGLNTTGEAGRDLGGRADVADGNSVIQGIEKNAAGERVAYHFLEQHPGATHSFGGSNPFQTRRVPAEDVIHLFDVIGARPGQVRGVPLLTPVVNRLSMLDDYEDAELERKRQEACTVAITTVEDTRAGGVGLGRDASGNVEDNPIPVDSQGDAVEVMEPGLIIRQFGGKSTTFHTPTAIGGFEENIRVHLRGISTGAGVPYSFTTGDLASVNFSSLRHGLNQYHAQLSQTIDLVIKPVVCEMLWSWFLEGAFVAGELAPRAGGYPVEWFNDAWPSVDRIKDAAADAQELENRTTSTSALIRKKGRDPETVAAERRRDEELFGPMDDTTDDSGATAVERAARLALAGVTDE